MDTFERHPSSEHTFDNREWIHHREARPSPMVKNAFEA